MNDSLKNYKLYYEDYIQPDRRRKHVPHRVNSMVVFARGIHLRLTAFIQGLSKG